MEPKYRVVRFYRDDEDLNGELVDSGLTLEEAQASCSDDESSSATAIGVESVRRTLTHGPWFNGYTEDR